VDSGIIEVGDDELDELDELASEDEDGDIVKAPRPKKRKRSPSPDLPPVGPVLYNEEPDMPSDSEDMHGNATVLNINIPMGYHGRLTVIIDQSSLNKSAQIMIPPQAETQAIAPPPKSTKSFTSLPPELRNHVYDLLFVAENSLALISPNNFCRSAQFLRTCKMVHSEGCGVLYGKNRFVFDRNRHQQGPFWEPQRKEIGYQDVRRFLKMIGPVNLANLRDVHLSLEDASPAATPYMPSHESRRYINDLQLMGCLRLLRDAKLQKLTLGFHGRRVLLETDVKFLNYLKQIKADEVASHEVRYLSYNKISMTLFSELKEVMTRKTKLYDTKPNTVGGS
jgi:hypothetical protein